MASPPRILIVDDDSLLCDYLKVVFEGVGFEVRVAHSGAEALYTVERFQPEVVILDIVMRGLDGKATLARLRRISNASVIFLSVLSDKDSIAEGLALGASDYVTKPFEIRELLARTRAILRRRPRMDQRPAAEPSNLPALDRIGNTSDRRPDLESGNEAVPELVAQAVDGPGQSVNLSPTELKILAYLMRHANHVVPYEELLNHVWGPDGNGRLPNLRAYIYLLRRKLEPDPGHPRYIRSARGLGYEFRAMRP